MKRNILEKYNLENFLQSEFYFVCEQFYTKRSRMLSIPSAICAFLTTPGQYLYKVSEDSVPISIFLGLLGMIAGLLCMLNVLMKFTEKSQICSQQGKLHLNLYQQVETELDKEWHDMSFAQFSDMLKFFNSHKKNVRQLIPPALAIKCKELEKRILADKLSTNKMEYNSIFQNLAFKNAFNDFSEIKISKRHR